MRSKRDRPRVIRIGTHAITAGRKSKLWSRLSHIEEHPVVLVTTVAQFGGCTRLLR